jgi:hypothetical protein
MPFRKFSHESLETVFCCLADRADQRRSFSCTEIPAYPATPYRKRQLLARSQAWFHSGTGFPFTSRGPPFRNRTDLYLLFQDCLADIEGTITCIILIKIRVPVITGADNIPVLLPVSPGYAARAGRIPESVFIYKKPPDKVFREFPVRIEMISPFFCFHEELFVPGFNLIIGWRG